MFNIPGTDLLSQAKLSTIGADELDFCVRDGNRYILIAKNAGNIKHQINLNYFFIFDN